MKQVDVEKCKKCKLYHLDTLTDGTTEDYCYPPFFPHMIAFSVPCKMRRKKRLQENLEKY